MTSAKTWKYEYIRDKTAADLFECIGAENDKIKESYEELFMTLEFDELGTECKMDGIEDLKRTQEWIDQGTSNNFQFRWCFMAKMLIVNHFSHGFKFDTKNSKVHNQINYKVPNYIR